MFIENQSDNFEFLSLGCFSLKYELAGWIKKNMIHFQNIWKSFKAGITKDGPFTKSYLFKGTLVHM